jgi:hydrogenase expression/formation protein HypC
MCLGIPGQIVAIINADDALATVDIAGVRRPVNISFVIDDRSADECIGDWVLVHVGFAMSRIDVDEAARTLALLEELGEMQAELEAMQVDATLPLPLREGVGGRGPRDSGKSPSPPPPAARGGGGFGTLGHRTQ